MIERIIGHSSLLQQLLHCESYTVDIEILMKFIVFLRYFVLKRRVLIDCFVIGKAIINRSSNYIEANIRYLFLYIFYITFLSLLLVSLFESEVETQDPKSMTLIMILLCRYPRIMLVNFRSRCSISWWTINDANLANCWNINK